MSTPRVRRRSSVRSGAGLFERETHDLYALFTGHPDMRRLLTDYGSEGHPLRKGFPLTGFVEPATTTSAEVRRLMTRCGLAQGVSWNFDSVAVCGGVDHARRRRAMRSHGGLVT